MPNRRGDFTLKDGMDIANTVFAFQDRAKRDAEDIEDRAFRLEDRDRKKEDWNRAREREDMADLEHQEDRAFTLKQRKKGEASTAAKKEYAAGFLSQGENYKPDMTAEGFDPVQFQSAWGDMVKTMVASEQMTAKRAANNKTRVATTRTALQEGANKAWEVFQVDPDAGYIQLAQLYDLVNDGIKIVQNADGTPAIDPKTRTIKVQNLNGTIADIQGPEPADAFNMVRNILQPGKLEEMVAMNSEQKAKYNASRLLNAEIYENPNGSIVAKVDKAWDDATPGGIMVTKVIDVSNGQEIPPEQFYKGKYQRSDRYNKKASGVKASLDITKKEIDIIKEKLEGSLKIFGKDTAPITDWRGEVTVEGQTAINKAIAAYEKYQGNPELAKTLHGKKEFAAAQAALSAYDELLEMQKTQPQEQAAPAISPDNIAPTDAPVGGDVSQGGKQLTEEVIMDFLKRADGDDKKAEELARMEGYVF